MSLVIICLITAVITFNIYFIKNQISTIETAKKELKPLSDFKYIQYESPNSNVNKVINTLNRILTTEKYQNLIFMLNIVSICTCVSIFLLVEYINIGYLKI